MPDKLDLDELKRLNDERRAVKEGTTGQKWCWSGSVPCDALDTSHFLPGLCIVIEDGEDAAAEHRLPMYYHRWEDDPKALKDVVICEGMRWVDGWFMLQARNDPVEDTVDALIAECRRLREELKNSIHCDAEVQRKLEKQAKTPLRPGKFSDDEH